jgi:uncharacterized membrane protein YidH (DUF202 family)
MEIVKHIIIRTGSLALVVYLFGVISIKMALQTSGNYPSMGFMLAVFGIGSVLILLIMALLLADTINLHRKKKLILRNCSLIIIGFFVVFLWFYIPKI